MSHPHEGNSVMTKDVLFKMYDIKIHGEKSTIEIIRKTDKKKKTSNQWKTFFIVPILLYVYLYFPFPHVV